MLVMLLVPTVVKTRRERDTLRTALLWLVQDIAMIKGGMKNILKSYSLF